MMAWSAIVEINSVSPATGKHVVGKVDGDTEAAALEGAKFVIDSLATGKLTFVRCKPEAGTWKNFDAKTVTYKGYVRFTVFDEAGDWDYGKGIVKLPKVS